MNKIFKKIMTLTTTASFALVPSIALVDLEAQTSTTAEVDGEALMQNTEETVDSVVDETEDEVETTEEAVLESESNVVIDGSALITPEADGRIILRRDNLMEENIEIDSSVQIDSAVEVETESDLALYAAGLLLADENAKKIELGNGDVQLTYRTHARLFGFIPVLVSATATVNQSGDVEVEYPWYAFLSSTNRAEIENDIAANLGSEEVTDEVADDDSEEELEDETEDEETEEILADDNLAEESESFTPNMKAIVLMHMHTAMSAQFENDTADMEAEGESDVDVEINDEV